MNHVTVRMAALAVFSAMLLGCATTAAVKDATVLSDSGKKGKDENSAVSRPVGAPTNIDGAIKQAQAQRKTGDFSDAAHTLSQLVLLAPAYNRTAPAGPPAKLPIEGVPMNTQSHDEFTANWDRQVGCADQYDPAAWRLLEKTTGQLT